MNNNYNNNMFIMSAQFESQVDSDVIVFIIHLLEKIQWFQWYYCVIIFILVLWTSLFSKN